MKKSGKEIRRALFGAGLPAGLDRQNEHFIPRSSIEFIVTGGGEQSYFPLPICAWTREHGLNIKGPALHEKAGP
jgi:hypothetical protein